MPVGQGPNGENVNPVSTDHSHIGDLATRETPTTAEALRSANLSFTPRSRPSPAGASSGSSRMRAPVASAIALAIAAAVGPCAASPVPRNGWPGRSMTWTSTCSGTPRKRRIG